MKVKAKTAVFYNGKRHEKDNELDIKKEAFDENLFEALEEKETAKTVKKADKKDEAETAEEE